MTIVIISIISLSFYILYRLYKHFSYKDKINSLLEEANKIVKDANKKFEKLKIEENAEKINLQSSKKSNDIKDIKNKINKQENKYGNDQ